MVRSWGLRTGTCNRLPVFWHVVCLPLAAARGDTSLDRFEVLWEPMVCTSSLHFVAGSSLIALCLNLLSPACGPPACRVLTAAPAVQARSRKSPETYEHGHSNT